ASSAFMVTFASRSAASTTGTMARRCSREASSGTTPPYGEWMAICEATTFESWRAPRSTMAAAVSSQELSIPNINPSNPPVAAGPDPVCGTLFTIIHTRGMSVVFSGGLEAAAAVVHTLAAAGHRAYLVGGCVRDLLMGHEPADYDVATDARPDAVMA